MKKVTLRLFVAVMSFMLFSCMSNSTSTEEQGGIQIDPQLKELGEMNALLLQYDDVGDKLGDCIAVKSKKKWGLINLNGDTVLDLKYANIVKPYNCDVLGIKNSEKFGQLFAGFVDAHGKILFNPESNKSYDIISNEYFVEKKQDVYTLYDKDGKEVFIADNEEEMDFPAYDIRYNGHGLFMIKADKWYIARLTDSKTDVSVFGDNGYSEYGFTNDDLCFVKNDEGKWGVVNAAGEIVTPFKYCDKKGQNIVQNEEGKWGLFNGKDVTTYYDNLVFEIDDYTDGKDGEDYIVLDKQGKEMFRKKDLKLFPFYSNGVFLGNHSIYDSNGNTILALNDSLTPMFYLNEYVVVGTENGLHGIVDKKGNFVVPATKTIPNIYKDCPLILLTRNITDEFQNNERIIVNVTDIFNTKNGILTKTIFDLSLHGYKDGLSLAEVEGRHIYVNEEGKTGILNLEDVLKTFANKKEEMKKQEQEEGMEKIKQQIVDDINKMNGRKVLTETTQILDMKKIEDGTYKGRFYIRTEYETITYEVYNIQVDNDFNLIDFGVKSTDIRPTDKKPDGGIVGVDEIVDRMTGRIRR